MSEQDVGQTKPECDGRTVSKAIYQRLMDFSRRLLERLDERLDKRLVRTFIATLEAMLIFRHRSGGLLLSELGAFITSPAQAAAGTKRLGTLIRSRHWSATTLEAYHWHQAQQRVSELQAAGEEGLAIWDSSEVEKAESQHLEGLCPVRSLKAARLTRRRPGFTRPPLSRQRIFVPGWHWLGLLVSGMKGAPTLAAMRWWTSRGPLASDLRTEEGALLDDCVTLWGSRVQHIFDRGFAGAPWLTRVRAAQVRFVMRWPKRFKLVDQQGRERPAWEVVRGKRTQAQRYLWDAKRQCWRKLGLLAAPITHPDHPDWPLWLVVSRQGEGRSPWYLLTNAPCASLDQAWTTVVAYARRWQIEQSWRFSKSELAMESPRVWHWQDRLKLLLIASTVYAFLLTLLRLADPMWVATLLRQWCQRADKRLAEVRLPLYRLRSALSRLWLAHPPPPLAAQV